MILKFIIPCTTNDKIKTLKQNIALILSITRYTLIIEEFNLNNDFYAGVSITTNKKVTIFHYFASVSELPYPELESPFLRLLRLAIVHSTNYVIALDSLNLKEVKCFKTLTSLLTFIENQYNLPIN